MRGQITSTWDGAWRISLDRLRPDFQPSFSHQKDIPWEQLRFSMNGKFESLSQQGLQHPHELRGGCSAVSFSDNIVSVGIHPFGASDDLVVPQWYAPARICRSNAAPEGLVGQSEHTWVGFEARLVVSRPAPLDRRYLEGWWYGRPLSNGSGAPQDSKKRFGHPEGWRSEMVPCSDVLLGEGRVSLAHTNKLVLKLIDVKRGGTGQPERLSE
jgi:hypothetical protein